MCDVFVRYIELPSTVRGVTIPNDDNTFNIYINATICEDKQKQALNHELEHIKRDHFYDEEPAIKNEKELELVV